LTYGHFLLVFLVLPILVLAVLLRRRLTRRYSAATAAMVTIAIVYTTPWDNLIVALGVWTYDPSRIWGILLGVVPLEEYVFYVLQSLLTAQVLLGLAPHLGPSRRAVAAAVRPKPFAAIAPLVAFSQAPVPTGVFTYLLLEVGWALPVILLQWWVGHEILAARRRLLLAAVVLPSVYLTLADALAIREGVWILNPALTLGLAPLGIPVEEALFFTLTNTMLVQGLLLALQPAVPLARLRGCARVFLPH
jgi:lycopene cyclase domain-containing protein